jgi:hypothetical protein
MSMPPPPPDAGPPYQPPYAGGIPQPHPKGTTVLVLGILSIFCLGIVLGPIAIVMGGNALAEIDRNPAAYSNRGQVNAGRICGIIGVVLWVLGLILRLSV